MRTAKTIWDPRTCAAGSSLERERAARARSLAAYAFDRAQRADATEADRARAWCALIARAGGGKAEADFLAADWARACAFAGVVK